MSGAIYVVVNWNYSDTAMISAHTSLDAAKESAQRVVAYRDDEDSWGDFPSYGLLQIEKYEGGEWSVVERVEDR